MRIGFCAYIPWCRFHASAHNGCGTRAARAATGATYGESYSDCCRTPRHRPGNPPLIVATSAIDVSPAFCHPREPGVYIYRIATPLRCLTAFPYFPHIHGFESSHGEKWQLRWRQNHRKKQRERQSWKILPTVT